LASPPIATIFVPFAANPKSALAGVKTGPVVHVFVDISRRMLTVEFVVAEVVKLPTQ
jgi:hypothetical protein